MMKIKDSIIKKEKASGGTLRPLLEHGIFSRSSEECSLQSDCDDDNNCRQGC